MARRARRPAPLPRLGPGPLLPAGGPPPGPQPRTAPPGLPAGAGGQEAWLATAASLRSLLLDLLEQLGLQEEPGKELGTQVIKILEVLAGWQEVEGAQAVSFHWLVKKAIKVANPPSPAGRPGL